MRFKPWVHGALRRDFANGFLVAEILSRYYPTSVSTHSFENGVSTQSKRDNWAQVLILAYRCSYVAFNCRHHDADYQIHDESRPGTWRRGSIPSRCRGGNRCISSWDWKV